MKFAFDLHLHSCLSPCGSDENTPSDLAGMCAVAGLDIVALTDHNTCGNCRAFCAAAQQYGLLALPGMELTTAEEVHVVCLFPDLDRAEAFSSYVREHLPALKNDPRFFGNQLLMDSNDRLLGHETAFLAGASTIGIYEVSALTASYGGTAFPAHIDRPAFSLLSNLGFWDADMGFSVAELSAVCPPGFPDRPDLAGIRFLSNCDAHTLAQIPDAHQWMELPAKTPQTVLDWLKT